MKHFKIYELVSKQVYDKYGDNSIRFIDDRLLVTLDVIRDILGVPIVVNDWYWGGKNHQRGLRENNCQLVRAKCNTLYLSNHCFGRAFDAVSKYISAEAMRKKIEANKEKLPYNIRIESYKSAPSWLHVDLNLLPNQPKIVYFDA